MNELNIIKYLCWLLLFFLYPIYPSQAGTSALKKDEIILLADVSIHEKTKDKPTTKYKTKTSPKVIPHKVEQYEIEGYMDKKYVRVVLEVENKKRIVGNIYDKSGKSIYVHGEYQEGALYVYDNEGNEYQIVVE